MSPFAILLLPSVLLLKCIRKEEPIWLLGSSQWLLRLGMSWRTMSSETWLSEIEFENVMSPLLPWFPTNPCDFMYLITSQLLMCESGRPGLWPRLHGKKRRLWSEWRTPEMLQLLSDQQQTPVPGGAGIWTRLEWDFWEGDRNRPKQQAPHLLKFYVQITLLRDHSFGYNVSIPSKFCEEQYINSLTSKYK